VWAHRDCPKFLSTSVVSGTGKATGFKFGRHIDGVRQKAH